MPLACSRVEDLRQFESINMKDLDGLHRQESQLTRFAGRLRLGLEPKGSANEHWSEHGGE
jgi:hypothetical protein